MKFQLSEMEKSKYEIDGIIHPRRIWSEDEKKHFVNIIENCYIRNVDKYLPDRILHQTCPELIGLLRRPQVVDPISAILGENFLVWRSAFFCKEPFGRNQKTIPWHQDTYNWSLDPMKACTIWIAIDDVGEENGCLSVIPGSHSLDIDHIPGNENHSFSKQARPEQVDTSRARKILLKSGEYAIFNENLLHSSPINMSNSRRCGLAVRIIPSNVKVLNYDSPEHGLITLKGKGDTTLNKIIEP
jgi:ectoine hydroxylase-related dioxygenase (phytanoyl-CoA dioxygenase family)